MRSQLKGIFFLVLILLAAAAWKIWLLSRGAFPFNADEAVVALMARHILEGARPTFFYGQAYMGSLDAFLVAAGFSWFGQNVWVVRLVQLLLYLATIITTVGIGKVAFGSVKIGLIAALFLAIPTVNSTLYTTVSLGGYGEAMLLGSLNLLTGFWILKRLKSHSRERYKLLGIFLSWGVIAGLGLWANGLTLVFSAPMGIAILVMLIGNRRTTPGYWKVALSAVPGFLLGSLPWWLFAFQNGFQTLVVELFGSAVAVEQQSWILKILIHIENFGLLGLPAALGLRPPWTIEWLALPLIPFIMLFWGLVLYFLFRNVFRHEDKDWTYPVLGGVILVFILAFLLTPFGADPSGRYLLPLAIPLSLAAAGFLVSKVERRSFQIGLVGLVLVFNVWGTLQCAAVIPPGISTQFDSVTVIDQQKMPDLINYLRENGETRGYSNYWVAYPLAFLSDENLVFVPRLPYHEDLRFTLRDDRYPAYDNLVAGSQRVAYITTNNPALENFYAARFQNWG